MCPGTHNPDSYDVWSLGPDGINGTQDDIGNWK
jgi:general secretion pathway protein G